MTKRYSAWRSLSPWNRVTVVAFWVGVAWLLAALITDWRLT